MVIYSRLYRGTLDVARGDGLRATNVREILYCASGCAGVGCRNDVPRRRNWSHLEFLMSKRILVVDDNFAIRGLVRKIIESRPGLEICGEATDGLEGIEKGRELKPDLIVLDFLMPRINGLQAAAIFHEIVPNTPIILFTFYKDAVPSELARAAGVASILSKTDQITTLGDEVQRLTAA